MSYHPISRYDAGDQVQRAWEAPRLIMLSGTHTESGRPSESEFATVEFSFGPETIGTTTS